MANPFKTAEQKQKKAPGSRPEQSEQVKAEVLSEFLTNGVVTKDKEEAPALKPDEKAAEAVVEVKPVEVPEVKVEEQGSGNQYASEAKKPAKAGKGKSKSKRKIPGQIEKKPRKKTYGFYLEMMMVEELEVIANDNDITISTLVEAILRNYLNEEE